MTTESGGGTATIGLVVVNYGAAEMVEQNVVRPGEAAACRVVVVVDNHMSDAESARMQSVADRHGWTLKSLPTNVGFGTACNIGARAAFERGCTSVVFLNPDATISSEDLARLGEATIADPSALIAPLVRRPDGSRWSRLGRIAVHGSGLARMQDPVADGDVAWLTGACVAVHRRMWDRLGGFDDDYFLYWEDVDLSYRCHRLGGRLILREDLTAVHDVGGTQEGGGGKSPTYFYYNCRNRLLFAAKHLPSGDRWRWLLGTPRDVRSVLNRGGPRQYLRWRAALWPATRGSVQGAFALIDPRQSRARAARRHDQGER